jgi:general secretion pathway protein B
MSYILDALRKADAERERGSVPDLHAQLLPLGGPEVAAEPVRSSPLLWLGFGMLLAGAVGAAWWALGDSEVATPLPPVATPALPAPAAVALPAASAPVAMVSPAVTAPPAAPQPAPRPETAAPQPVPKAAAKPKAEANEPAATTPQPRTRPAAPPKAASAPAVQPPVAPAAPARLPTLADLPADLRQQVPPLVIGGSVYSPQASVRMVIVNGQVFQEGNSLAPELKLEQVRQKTAVFSIRGQRFEVPL